MTTGLHKHRLTQQAGNPREVAIAELWTRQHAHNDTLRTLFEVPCMDDDPDKTAYHPGWGWSKTPLGEPTERDRIVAASIIQWTMTGCGMSLVNEALEANGYRIVRKDDE